MATIGSGYILTSVLWNFVAAGNLTRRLARFERRHVCDIFWPAASALVYYELFPADVMHGCAAKKTFNPRTPGVFENNTADIRQDIHAEGRRADSENQIAALQILGRELVQRSAKFCQHLMYQSRVFGRSIDPYVEVAGGARRSVGP